MFPKAPLAPGGTCDELARILAAGFTTAYQQTFYVENRPGAGGMIGSAAVAMAEPDGYTLSISCVLHAKRSCATSRK